MRNEINLRVKFLKCHTRVFKKASELAILCGVDLIVIMFSPSNRVFSFGSSNYLNEAYSTLDEGELYAHLNYLTNQITIDKKCIKDLNYLLKVIKDQFWWGYTY
ncbi:hypothetical protein JHK85_004868 [Glycine max]|uniref:MADS-box domain-containing protein n=2 Tax=Glycine subgen. Soja TaxID=1462606 RepID=A0A0R0KYZ0_SOYBN|nr:hypothetical protein JHK85_004868 [Glycine max]KAG5080638.1 hypothetical protein JHK86_004703 [Glycine max]KAH1061017.1 hypothetical protein GYH30_004488 [Glycine max]RZC25653.1 Agamous-like MADS-box protein AGL62 [Glycine soja]